MIPIGRSHLRGRVVRRVTLMRSGEIVAPVNTPSGSSLRIRLWWGNKARTGRDLIGTYDSTKHKISDLGTFSLTGTSNLDREYKSGDMLLLEAERFGYGPPTLKGFSVEVTSMPVEA